MKTSLIAAYCLAFLFVAAVGSDVFAGAKSSAGGSIADRSYVPDVDQGAFSVTSFLRKPDADDGGTFFESESSVAGPTLKAKSTAALANSFPPPLFSVTGHASAEWDDELTPQSPDVLIDLQNGLLNTVDVWFFPNLKGHGSHGQMNFLSSVYLPNSPNNLNKYGVLQAEWDGPNHPYSPPDFAMPELLKFPATWFLDVVRYKMSLSVDAYATSPGEVATVDFSHTAILPPIVIADKYGMPIPELAGRNFNFVGSSGFVYTSLTAVPAPVGDYNHNGVVDAADYVVWRNSVGTGTIAADGNNDGLVDDEDYKIWRMHFGQIIDYGVGLGAGVAIPEPATGMIALIGALTCAIPMQRGRQLQTNSKVRAASARCGRPIFLRAESAQW